MRRLILPLAISALALGAGPSCKIAITDINAGFDIIDAVWFAEEETLFFFYEVQAEQGIGDDTVIEITYTTDDGVVDWVVLKELQQVHRHVDVDCGATYLCGSGSLHVPLEPRDVRIRLRYHRDGELALTPATIYNVVGFGPPHLNRSMLVYGVFDEVNRAIQWRGRHKFPTLRNEEAQRLGLRRRFTIDTIGYEANLPDPQATNFADNAYLYGAGCPAPVDLGWLTVETDERAIFSPEELPQEAYAVPGVCSRATVYDPTGPFSTTAVARKNPDVRPAFPLLRSPIREATAIKYVIRRCERSISQSHLEMQRQRLLYDDPDLCIDGLTGEALLDVLEARFREDIELVRADGADMVIAIALHHDEPNDLSGQIELVLARIFADERLRSTPRVAGGFMLDSYGYQMTDATAGALTVWCPSTVDPESVTNPEDILNGGVTMGGIASLGCILPPINSLGLGPFDVGALPILPNRAKYLSFIDTYSEDQTGRMISLTFRAPEITPNADSLAVDPFGTATFFNDEIITTEPGDTFSFCETNANPNILFRSPFSTIPLPISTLPEWHALLQEETYGIGILWEFPYLLTIRYEAVAALAVSAFGASLPFGLGTNVDQPFGSALWETGEFDLAETLLQCTRYCQHPTFDGAGVYQVEDYFDEAYRTACYTPVYPQRGDSGFPRDP